MFVAGAAQVGNVQNESSNQSYSAFSPINVAIFYLGARFIILSHQGCFMIHDAFNCLPMKREVYSVYFPANIGKRMGSFEDLKCL